MTRLQDLQVCPSSSDLLCIWIDVGLTSLSKQVFFAKFTWLTDSLQWIIKICCFRTTVADFLFSACLFTFLASTLIFPLPDISLIQMIFIDFTIANFFFFIPQLTLQEEETEQQGTLGSGKLMTSSNEWCHQVTSSTDWQLYQIN